MVAHYHEQIGDYVIELLNPSDFWHVRMAKAENHISAHNSKAEAKQAIRRYRAADKKRLTIGISKE
jgi:hypothetical protein